jgi:hypothetical protein
MPSLPTIDNLVITQQGTAPSPNHHTYTTPFLELAKLGSAGGRARDVTHNRDPVDRTANRLLYVTGTNAL